MPRRHGTTPLAFAQVLGGVTLGAGYLSYSQYQDNRLEKEEREKARQRLGRQGNKRPLDASCWPPLPQFDKELKQREYELQMGKFQQASHGGGGICIGQERRPQGQAHRDTRYDCKPCRMRPSSGVLRCQARSRRRGRTRGLRPARASATELTGLN